MLLAGYGSITMYLNFSNVNVKIDHLYYAGRGQIPYEAVRTWELTWACHDKTLCGYGARTYDN